MITFATAALTDRNAAALVLEKIGEMGSASSNPRDHAMFRMLEALFMTATPRQMMEAALLAVEGK